MVIVASISSLIPFVLLRMADSFHRLLGLILESFMCYQLLAARSLQKESDAVYLELQKGDLDGARNAVSRIVGRDTDSLDEDGIIKAAVETVAENTSDGVIAPLIYLFFGGAVLGFAYKAINTMDSMVGYQNEKYRYFGTAAAKLDDIVNYIPARLSAFWMILAAYVTGMNGTNAHRVFVRDRYNHKSPNSAQTESVMAGALQVQLAGDAWYFGKLCKKPTIGDAIRDIKAEDIRQAHRLMYGTEILAALNLSILWWLISLV